VHVEYEQCKAIECHEVQTSVLEDTWMLLSFLFSQAFNSVLV
jgi:hypothetical protein